MKTKILNVFWALFLITGCVAGTTGNLSPERDSDDTYGQYPSNYEQIVKGLFKNREDISYQIKPPYKGYSTKPADRKALEDLRKVLELLELRIKTASSKKEIGKLTGNWEMYNQAEIERLNEQFEFEKILLLNQPEISRGRVIDQFGYVVEVSVSRGETSLRYWLLIRNGEVIQYGNVTEENVNPTPQRQDSSTSSSSDTISTIQPPNPQSQTGALPCEKECSELMNKGQLKRGVTLEECINRLCK